MGFGTVAANIILFIGIISLAAGFVILANTYVSQTSGALVIQKNNMVNELKTDITIQSDSYDSVDNYVLIYVKNTGKTELNMNNTDVYINGERIGRADRVITKEADTQVAAPPIWDPSEELKINVSKTLPSGVSKIKITTDYSGSAEDSISVS